VLGEEEEDKETGEQGEGEEEMALVNICCSNIYTLFVPYYLCRQKRKRTRAGFCASVYQKLC